MLCYGLDRFSVDIDLDGQGSSIKGIIDRFCANNGYSYRVAKDTDTVNRYMINYGDDMHKPLKVEVSFRRKSIEANEYDNINGILVYKIDSLTIMKSNAYTSRDKIRDLFDLTFICNNYFDNLSPQTLTLLRSAIEYKGLEQLDYVLREQDDELIDKDKLVESFLIMFEKLGLLYDKEEKELLQRLP